MGSSLRDGALTLNRGYDFLYRCEPRIYFIIISHHLNGLLYFHLSKNYLALRLRHLTYFLDMALALSRIF